MNVRSALSVVLLLALVGACGPSAAAREATSAALDAQMASTQAAIDARATNVQGTQQAADQQGTAAAGTATAKVEATRAAQETQTERTSVAVHAATQSASSMADWVDKLRTDGYVTASGGVYQNLPSFDESWAQLNWYQVYPAGDLDPTDFVLRADASWESASRNANWFNSGCGIVFRYKDIDNHYMVYLGLDGYVNMLRVVRGVFANMGRDFFGQVDVPEGEAAITVVAEGSRFLVFVNEEKVLERDDFGLPTGWLGYTLVSGTNKDFGTRCQLHNVELWELE